MASHILTPKAHEDIVGIQRFLMLNAPHAEETVAEAIVDACDRLGQSPGLGHKREDLAPAKFRFYRVFSYLIVYIHATRPVQIVRVIHSARDVRSELKRGGAR
ncbi:hypothetical protein PHYC_01251 [Phycisphaerales bacterium]|nr:hypothetical protein PHYC_01251 [Phycisphaerales bacterium]